MTLLNKLLLSTLLANVFNFSFAQQNLLDFDHSLQFARYLATTRQYTFAEQEYERLNFLWPNDSVVKLELVQTYRLNNQCEKFYSAFDLLSDHGKTINNRTYLTEYLRFSLNCRIKEPVYKQNLLSLNPEEIAFYTASYYWVNHYHDSLINYYTSEKDLLNRANLNLAEITKSFSEQKYKSPFLASAMSAFLPGSGKAYSKRWGDAFVSFLFVGTNSFASYRAFNKKGAKSVNGWIFGSLAVSFYSANIWGSAKAAKNYNQKIKDTYQFNAESIIYNSY